MIKNRSNKVLISHRNFKWNCLYYYYYA